MATLTSEGKKLKADLIVGKLLDTLPPAQAEILMIDIHSLLVDGMTAQETLEVSRIVFHELGNRKKKYAAELPEAFKAIAGIG